MRHVILVVLSIYQFIYDAIAFCILATTIDWSILLSINTDRSISNRRCGCIKFHSTLKYPHPAESSYLLPPSKLFLATSYEIIEDTISVIPRYPSGFSFLQILVKHDDASYYELSNGMNTSCSYAVHR